METSVLCPLHFTISLLSPWEKKDTAWEVKPNTRYQKACISVMAAEQEWSEMCSARRPKAIPKNQEHVGAELGGPAAGARCQSGVCVGLEFVI